MGSSPGAITCVVCGTVIEPEPRYFNSAGQPRHMLCDEDGGSLGASASEHDENCWIACPHPEPPSGAVDPDDPSDEPGEMGHDGTTNPDAPSGAKVRDRVACA